MHNAGPASTASNDPAPVPEASAGERLRAHWRAELERWAAVSAHAPLAGAGPLGAALGLSRRAVRYLLRWYINPIVEQQNHFNAAAVSLDALDQARQRELEAELRDLRDRVAHLEARLGGRGADDPGARQ
jgi:hypothetical protein